MPDGRKWGQKGVHSHQAEPRKLPVDSEVDFAIMAFGTRSETHVGLGGIVHSSGGGVEPSQRSKN